jgi:hypothetical protein
MLNVKLCDLRGGGCWWLVASHLFSRPVLLYTKIKSRHGNKEPAFMGSSEMALSLPEAMRAIASLGCEGAMRGIASSMSPHASPQRGTKPIFTAETAGDRTAVQTASVAAKTLPTTPTRER